MAVKKRPARPPFGPPFGPGGPPPGPGGPPFGPGGPQPGPGGSPAGPGGPPSGPPPKFTPSEAQAITYTAGSSSGGIAKAVDPGAVFPCLYRYTYIWPNRGRGFWSYITFVGPRSVAGWRYNNWGWEYFGMDLKRIRSFYCF